MSLPLKCRAFILRQRDLFGLDIGKCVGGQNMSHVFMYGITVLPDKPLHNIGWHQTGNVVHSCGCTESEDMVLSSGMLEQGNLLSKAPA